MTLTNIHPGDVGATSVEYALLAAFVAAVISATVALLGVDVVGLYDRVTGSF